MKNIFGVLTENKTYDGECFVSRQINPIIEEKLNSHLEKTNNLQKEASLPGFLLVIRLIVGFLSLSIISGIIGSLGDVSLIEGYNNAPYLFYIGGVSLLIWIMIVIYSKYKKENALSSDECKVLIEESDELLSLCLDDLKVPNDFELVDVFSYGYKVSNNKEKQITSLFKYINMELRMFKEEDNICLADTNKVYSFPISSIKDIKLVNKRISFYGWNKDIAYNSKEFKQYKITSNNNGVFLMKSYYSIIINNEIEDYEILVPIYDIDKFLSLTNLKLEEKDNIN